MAEHREREQTGRESASVEHPMPSLVDADRVIDDAYGGNPNARIPRQRIYEAAVKAKIVPDVMYYFDHLPDKQYTKSELINELNRMVRERGREKEVGLFGVGPGAQEAEQKRQRAA
jgi:hypothetical protein